MEEVHGVDVSWIHHSHKDRLHPTRSAPPVPPKDDGKPGSQLQKTTTVIDAASQPTTTTPQKAAVKAQRQDVPQTGQDKPDLDTAVPAAQPQSIPSSPSQSSKLPGLLRRNSREKINDNPPPRVNPRRSSASSWISSISSKLGTSNSPHPSPSQPTSATQNTTASPVTASSSSTNASQTGKAVEDGKPYPQPPPKSGSASFLSNALRRLSSGTQIGKGGTASYNGGVTPRRVLNQDPNRQRCMLPELDSTKLRRVAFCVDVEIAGAPKYKDDDGNVKEIKKQKTGSMKAKDKEEGAALKRPAAVLVEKDEEVTKTAEVPTISADSEPKDAVVSEPKDAVDEDLDKKDGMKKKDKKKRSDEERQERKEQKRRRAEESGSVPMQITRENSAESTPEKNSNSAIPRPLDRPTTDPLRIYRRCCQLRETPILKRITDQLASPTICQLSSPGVVTVLDLTGSRLQLSDMITLSDWLAIVPVRKLYLDDSGLNDEGLRVILSGLLAAMTPDFSRKPKTAMQDKYEERSGIVEKLVLKNNPKITKEGWKHISLFIYMCKSLKAIDVSMNAFPSTPPTTTPIDLSKPSKDPIEIFAKAISERFGGNHLEELSMGECSLTTHHIRKIIDAVTISGITRLGLAGNSIDAEGLGHVIRYIRSGVCQGLDLGGNDLRDHLDTLGDAFDTNTPVWALSLADCNLDTLSLKPLFPALLNLQDLRFLDLSHNPELFTTKINVLGILTKYLPMLPELRRLHFNNVDMAPWQAISLADIIGECPVLAHIAILGNPQLTALASAKGEEEQEEACALYASLMAAARVSSSIISIEIDVPTVDNSEIVRALAQQVVAYCLRNMESFYPAVSPESPITGSANNGPTKSNVQPKEVEVPEILLHLVGHHHHDGELNGKDEEDPGLASDMDYIVGGTGVVKALKYCLEDLRKGSVSMPQSGTASPRESSGGVRGVKAKNMSKNLLESARRIRERLQPALLREMKGHDDWAFRRLLFLDNTLRGIIERFEAEYPETRIAPQPGTLNSITPLGLPVFNISSSTIPDASTSQTLTSPNGKDSDSDYDEDEYAGPVLRRTSRQLSDVSLAAKALGREEGTVHKLGQQAKRKILEHENIHADDGHISQDSSKPATPGEIDNGIYLDGDESSIQDRIEDEHIRVLKEKLVMLSGASSNLEEKSNGGHGHD